LLSIIWFLKRASTIFVTINKPPWQSNNKKVVCVVRAFSQKRRLHNNEKI
jgi:hypothetical protein